MIRIECSPKELAELMFELSKALERKLSAQSSAEPSGTEKELGRPNELVAGSTICMCDEGKPYNVIM